MKLKIASSIVRKLHKIHNYVNISQLFQTFQKTFNLLRQIQHRDSIIHFHQVFSFSPITFNQSMNLLTDFRLPDRKGQGSWTQTHTELDLA